MTPPRPRALPLIGTQIPADLRALNRWVCWNYALRGKGWTKVPVTPRGRAASSTDPATWSAFHPCEMNCVLSLCDGVGLVLGEDLQGIDLDDCRELGTEKLSPLAQEILARVAAYAEVSPSGTGIKLFGRFGFGRSHVKPGLELYAAGRYFAVTGQSLPGHTDLVAEPQDLSWLIAREFGASAVSSRTESQEERRFEAYRAPLEGWPLERVTAELLPHLDPGCGYFEWISVGSALHHQGQGDPAWLEAWDDWSSSSSKWAAGVCAQKWKSFSVQRGNGVVTLASLIKRTAASRGDAPLQHPRRATRGCDHLKAARQVIEAFGEGNLIDANGNTWNWHGDGVWRPMNDREIKQKIHEVADENGVTAGVVSSILDLVRTEAHKPEHRFDVNPTTINLVNGELAYVEGAWRLQPHKREHFRTARLPINYDPAATAPRFEQFLREVFHGDVDASEKVSVVAEALGYTLVPSCHLEKFFMLVGQGANGKSVLLAIVAGLVGREHACAVQPSQFENRFQRGHLQGKLANIVTEIAEGAEIADAQLKSLVSGEVSTAEHKHKNPFDFTPYAKHWFGTNHLPHTRDFSDALFRRAVILTFNRKFEGANRDVRLADKLRAELPGILNLALDGLRRLFTNEAFTEPSSSIAIVRQWRMEADQVAQFVEDACDTGTGCRATSAELFSAYSSWAMDAGIRRTLNRANFTTRLRRLGFEPGRGTGGTRMIAGVQPTTVRGFRNDDASAYAAARG